MPEKPVTAQQASKRLSNLTVVFQIVFFVSLGLCVLTVALLPSKDMLHNPFVKYTGYFLTGLNLFSVAALIVIYLCRFVRWWRVRGAS